MSLHELLRWHIAALVALVVGMVIIRLLASNLQWSPEVLYFADGANITCYGTIFCLGNLIFVLTFRSTSE